MEKFKSEITRLFEDGGGQLYGGEPITQSEHGLQCAQLAEDEGAGPHLIIAALLHDIGHFIDKEFEPALRRGDDRFHENLGAKYLSQWFGPEVLEPVRLHVPAKRYLCAVDPAYHNGLSDASKHTLRIQGGPMSDEDVAEFETNLHFKDAVRLRKWDDLGKVPDMETKSLAHFLAYADWI